MNTVTASRQMTAASLAMHPSPDAAKRPASGLSRLLRGMAGWIAEFLDRRAARRQLYEMSDYQLADIGVSRGQIDHVFDRGLQDVTWGSERLSPRYRQLGSTDTSKTLLG
jgi:uncharacterized protein YjiS (DUF1127 family)